MSSSSSPQTPQRRNPPRSSRPLGPPATPSNTAPAPKQPTTSRPPLTSPSTLLPTPAERLLLALYPTTLALGSLVSLLSPEIRRAPYSAETHSHPPAYAPSYWAQKSNIFNVYFVKVGWFWITAAFVAYQLVSVVGASIRNPSSLGVRERGKDGRRRGASSDDGGGTMKQFLVGRAQAILRFALVTTWWVFVTQWFFGPALIDRGFRFTGGKCEGVNLQRGVGKGGLPGAASGQSDVEAFQELATQIACRMAGGAWIGGHDISGHVFLLVLGSASLAMEVLPGLWGRVVGKSDGAQKETGKAKGDAEVSMEESSVSRWALLFVAGVGALCWWMLLMTAMFFHTWFEKLTGLLVASFAIFTVYFLPRGVPILRAILGSPGVIA